MIEKMLKIANDEVGYLEKKSLADLDSKIKNAGNNNFTKYAQELKNAVGSPFVNGVPWCVMFVQWCFFKAYGEESTKRFLHIWTMSCGAMKEEFIKHNEYHSDPMVGDIVIFEWYKTVNSKKEIKRHTGIVYKVDKDYVYTIEGNTDATRGAEVIENGGGVFKKSYKRNHPRINGYCRPAYVEVALPVLNRRQQITGKNDKRQCRLLQQNLNSLGYKGKDGNKLAVDGSFGGNTEFAVKAFQRANNLDDDGSYGKLTYRKMLEVMC